MMTGHGATGYIPHWHHSTLTYLGWHTVEKCTVQACAVVSLPPNHTACRNLTTLALLALGIEEGIAVWLTALWIASWRLPRYESSCSPSWLPYLNMPCRPGRQLWKRISSPAQVPKSSQYSHQIFVPITTFSSNSSQSFVLPAIQRLFVRSASFSSYLT
jgi:hypothetical protein